MTVVLPVCDDDVANLLYVFFSPIISSIHNNLWCDYCLAQLVIVAGLVTTKWPFYLLAPNWLQSFAEETFSFLSVGLMENVKSLGGSKEFKGVWILEKLIGQTLCPGAGIEGFVVLTCRQSESSSVFSLQS